MNLTHKFLAFSLTLMGLVGLIGGVSVWNAVALLHATQAAAAEYDAFDHAQTAGNQVFWLRSNLRGIAGNTYRDVKYLAPIRKDLNDLSAQIALAGRGSDAAPASETQLVADAARQLDEVAQDFTDHPAGPVAGAADPAVTALEAAERSLATLTQLGPAAARRHVTFAAAAVHERLLWMCFWLVVTLAVSAIVHLRQYRALVRPLLWLRDNMRRSATQQYHPIEPRGDGEFREVAAYFNGLARELAELYRSLEDKVIARSRELVRSERLASVGFLAAGVAHEINNPLSVISGYAELAEKSLQKVFDSPGGSAGSEAEIAAEADALESAVQAQNIIREEAFRCKEITSRLLSLARGGGDGRQLLSLADLARQVGTLTKGLRNYRTRTLIVDFDAREPLAVVVNSTEMKQAALLNLTVNALEATPDHGEVRVGGHRNGDTVEIFVEDNGKGMTPDILNQIFEPFFTAKRGANEPGTGLGLSITHAIIENHGGNIRAYSPGPGRGSRFTVTLPAAKVVGNGVAKVLPA